MRVYVKVTLSNVYISLIQTGLEDKICRCDITMTSGGGIFK